MNSASPRNPEETIFTRALSLPATERSVYLENACGGDSNLRRRLEVLLQAETAAGFMSAPAAGLASIACIVSRPEVAPRTLPGRYRLLQEIASGGMGEVYEAEDTDLHRIVAVKILPEYLAANPESLERFKEEARALAAINHPNIVTIHSVEEFQQVHFLTMERVTGRPLTSLIPKGGFDVEQLLALAIPLTDALAAAHSKGIGHRDLKPSNVMVNDQGRIKVIDFGLAKFFRPSTAPVRREAPDVRTTVDGEIVGTPAYMSPEQIEGGTVDHRSDIFSLGILICELATAHRPFTGETAVAVMTSILRDAPRSLAELKPTLPEGLDRILERCLRKDPNERYGSAIDVRNDLNGLEAATRRVPSLLYTAGIEEEFAADVWPRGSRGVCRNNLPVPLTSFIGRERPCAELTGLIASKSEGKAPGIRLLTLTGPGGTGKTRLALQVAAGFVERFRDGVWLVELAALSDPLLVPQTVASAVGLRHESKQPPRDLLMRYLAPKQMLLLLDNCEHLVAACSDLADALLRSCPLLQIFVTSREPLGLAGETIWPVPALSVPSLPAGQAGVGALNELGDYESIKLFDERARASAPAFELTEQNVAVVAQICRRLDGIPLAIELAATRARLLPVEQLLERMQDRFRILTGGSRTVLPRQKTLRATVDWSYGLLSDRERILFERLSVFAGGWTLEAAEAVCADEKTPTKVASESQNQPLRSSHVLDLLGNLLDKSMIMAERSIDGAARYRILETLRQYAQERLAERGDAAIDALRFQHTSYYIALGEQAAAGMYGPDQPKWSDRLEIEHDNIRAGLEWGKAADAPPDRVELVLRLAAPLNLAWYRRGYGRESRQHFETLLSHRNAQRPTRARAQVLFAVGNLALWQDGDAETAWTRLNESLSLAESLGDTRVMANARHHLGQVLFNRGDIAGARLHHEEALRLTRSDGDLSGMRLSLEDLADVAVDEGRFEHASELQEQALSLAQQSGDQHAIASVLQGMGTLARVTGKLSRARELIGEGLSIMQRTGCLSCSAYFLDELAFVASASDDPERAVRLLGTAEALRERTGIVPRAFTVPIIDSTMQQTRRQLGSAAYSEAWAEGRAMSLRQATTYAVDLPPPALLL